jgi:hypothetical protein
LSIVRGGARRVEDYVNGGVPRYAMAFRQEVL